MTLSTPSLSGHGSRRLHHRLPIASLQGRVHRFLGVVDRLNSGDQDAAGPASLRLRDPQLAESRQPLACDRLDLPLGEVWIQAGVQEGDTVLFTAKVPHRSQAPTSTPQPGADPTAQEAMPPLLPRGVVVLRRRQTNGHRLRVLKTETQQLQLQLQQLEADSERLRQHRDALRDNNDRLQQALASRTAGIGAERRSRLELQRAVSGLKRRLVGTALLALLAGAGLGLAAQTSLVAGDGSSQGSGMLRRQ